MRAESRDSWESLAARQHGLLSRTQAFDLGLSRTKLEELLERGSLIRGPGLMPCGAARYSPLTALPTRPRVAATLRQQGCWEKAEAGQRQRKRTRRQGPRFVVVEG